MRNEQVTRKTVGRIRRCSGGGESYGTLIWEGPSVLPSVGTQGIQGGKRPKGGRKQRKKEGRSDRKPSLYIFMCVCVFAFLDVNGCV